MDLERFLESRGGVVAARDLELIGLSAAQRAALVRRGDLLHPRRDVYLARIAQDPFGHELHRLTAIGIARSTGLIPSHEAAALIHGLDVLSIPDRMCTVHPDQPYRRGRGDLALYPALPPRLIAAASAPYDDVHAVSPAACAIQISSARGGEAGLVTAESALRMGTRLRDLHAAAALMKPRSSRVVEQVMSLASASSESAFESRCKWAFHVLGLPQPEQQVQIYDHDGFVARVDFKVRRLIIEADGLGKYTTPEKLRREKIRDLRLRRLGFNVVHLVWHDLDDLGALGRYLVAQGMPATAA